MESARRIVTPQAAGTPTRVHKRATTASPKHGRQGEQEELDWRSIVFGLILSLLLAPITFQATRSIETNQFKSDFLATLLTLASAGIFVFLINIYLKQNCHQSSSGRQDQSQLKSLLQSTLLDFFSSTSPFRHHTGGHATNNLRNGHKLNQSTNSDDNETSFRNKIDPKYFRPKFIIHELVTFWGTTCTVVTWGSFYLIGGTIVATEKLARKIKTKCQTNNSNDYLHNSSRGTGRSASTFATNNNSYSQENEMHETLSNSNNNNNSSTTGPKTPLRRVSSWTKRSFTSIKKRIGKFVSTSAPQMTALASGRSDNRPHGD